MDSAESNTGLPFSEDNFGKIKSIFSLDEYLAFEKQSDKRKPANLAVNTTGTPPKKNLQKTATETKQASPVKEVAVTAATNATTQKQLHHQNQNRSRH